MIATKTRVMLWGRAAAKCSLPDCRLSLVLDETETDDASLVGESCHIVAESELGPRGVSSLTLEERNKYANLILMCNVHHKMIDDQPEHFTVEVLHQMKADHESYIENSLSSESKKTLRDREVVAGYIDHWVSACDLEDWNAWTSWLTSSQAGISNERLLALEKLPHWLLSRVWPNSFPQLDSSLSNFRKVLSGFLNIFKKHSESVSGEGIIEQHQTKQFYRIDEWNESLYNRLVDKYVAHNALVADYALELTRAANYVCECVRQEVLVNFRLSEGYLLVTCGPGMNLRYTTYRPTYDPSDFPELFTDEEGFNRRRVTRDISMGTSEEVALFAAEYEQRRNFFS